MKKAVLYAHGGSGNHGCEALMRTTSDFLKKSGFDGITVISRSPDEDKKYYPEFDGRITRIGESFSGITPARIAAKLVKTVTGSVKLYDRREMKALFDTKDAVCFSIGGDNYCYGDYNRYIKMNTYLTQNGSKTVLWGCSVEPDRINLPEVKADLKRYSLITARESITYNAMKNAGLENVMLCPDPAFLLQPTETELPDIFGNDVVGINISPLVMNYESDGGITMKNYCALIEHVLADTDMNIAFIPHVVWSFNDDLKPLGELFEKYKKTGRVALADSERKLNCAELKYIISKCRFLVAARTHASIAAYSTGVPALVTGYSVKAKGIAKDIFGTYDNYVCPVQSMTGENVLVRSFDFIVSNEDEIKKALKSFNSTAFNEFAEIAKRICYIAGIR